MSLFGPYIYKNSDGKKFFLHLSQNGDRKLYFFSKDPRGALNSLPPGYEVFENEDSGLPMLRKSTGGFLDKILDVFGGKKKKTKP